MSTSTYQLPPSSPPPRSSLPGVPLAESRALGSLKRKDCFVEEEDEGWETDNESGATKGPDPIPAYETELDDGMRPSTPIKGSPKTQASIRARKRERKKKEEKIKSKKQRLEEATQEEENKAEAQTAHLVSILKNLLHELHNHELTFGDLLLQFFDPAVQLGNMRWDSFWKSKTSFEKIMDLITSAHNATPIGCKRARRWALELVARKVSLEAKRITTSKCLQSRHRVVDQSYVFDYDLDSLHGHLETFCPTMLEIVGAFSISQRQKRAASRAGMKGRVRKVNRKRVITTSMLSLLREYSQYNNYHHQILGLFLFGSGTQRQVFSVLSRFGVVVTYTSLLRAEGKAPKQLTAAKATGSGETLGKVQDKPRKVGLVRELSRCCRESARENAEDGCGAVVIDNINFMAQVSEQTIGHKDVQENGTCATLYRPPGITTDDLNLEELRQGYAKAPPPDINDLNLTPEEHTLLNKSNLHTVLSIIIDHGGDEYAKFKKFLEADCPESDAKMPITRTHAYPLPAMNVNEGRVDGIIQVDELIRKELTSPSKVSDNTGIHQDTPKRIAEAIEPQPSLPQAPLPGAPSPQPLAHGPQPPKPRLVRLYGGDQLTLAHLRSAIGWKLGNELAEYSLDDIELVPGLFHIEMTAVSMILEQNWNKTANSSLNPGSLRFHNTVLGRKPITITNAPPFRTSLDLISVSFYARVLAGLPISAGFSSWNEFTTELMNTDGVSMGIYKSAWERLCGFAKLFLDTFVNRREAVKLRQARQGLDIPVDTSNAPPNPSTTSHQGDTVLESTILFNEDALLLRNYIDSVKRGDSGRIIIILKVWALSFRSTRHTKYSYELMIFIHKFKHIWTPGLRKAILRAWLVNPSGRTRGFHAVDLLQEHMNLLIKTIYKARGSNDSWEWLGMISSCANALRELNKKFHNTFGDRQGTRHSSSDLTRDIKALVDNLLKHRVYVHTPGRQFDERDEPPLDSVTEGYKILTHAPSTSLSDLQTKFLSLQRRSQVPPLELRPANEPGTSQSAHNAENCLRSPKIVPTSTEHSPAGNSPDLGQSGWTHEQPEQEEPERGQHNPTSEEEVDDESTVRVGLYDMEDVELGEGGDGGVDGDNDTENIYDEDESSEEEESDDILANESSDEWL